VQHHDDDQWFHTQPAFVMLSTQFSLEVRELLAGGLGHQAAFVGHISVELLLDAVLIEDDSRILDAYYRDLRGLDTGRVQAAASRICPQPITVLTALIPRFIEERFLADYVDDQGLLYRLNQVMLRVRLPPLPQSLVEWLSTARPRVRNATADLLPPEHSPP
jgi:hypothetical protein